MVLTTDRVAALSTRSSYLEYLPAIYSQGDFMGRFLMIFESVLGPIEGVLDNISNYFDAGTAPKELLPWLASWVNLALDETWPLERRRELVGSAVELFRDRGTRRGLREYLRVYSGVEPRITEDYGGISLAGQARLGLNTILGAGRPHTFNVTLELDDPDSVNVEQLKAIIEAEKPAHSGYTLEILPKNAPTPGQ